MRTLKICLYEIISALALLGLTHVYFGDSRLLPLAHVLLVALYVVIAVATEAVITSSLRPEMWKVISLNVLVAIIVFVSHWTSDSSLKLSAALASGTLLLRVSVAGVSLQARQVWVRRITAALVGGTLLAETLVTLYSTGQRIYYDYYLYPKVKEGYIMPTRSQDFLGHTVFFGITILVLYLCYRLLKYAFRRQVAQTT